MNLIYPRVGEVYTLADIMNRLDLRDSPALTCVIAGRKTVINCSHVTNEQFLAVPKAADSTWRYSGETPEWVPIFKFVGPDNGVAEFCDLALLYSKFKGEYQRHALWITPKGHPRMQYQEPVYYGGSTTLEELLALPLPSTKLSQEDWDSEQ